MLSHLDPFQPINCSFGLKDRVFAFGTLTAQLPDLLGSSELVSASPRDPAKKGQRPPASAKTRASGGGAEGAPPATSVQKAAAAQPDTGSLLDDPAAVQANLKFINPKKVPCTVNFNIQPQNGSQAGALSAPSCWRHGIQQPLASTVNSNKVLGWVLCFHHCASLCVCRHCIDTLVCCSSINNGSADVTCCCLHRREVPHGGVPQQHHHPTA